MWEIKLDAFLPGLLAGMVVFDRTATAITCN